MTRTSPPQVAMSSGEVDPLLFRRFDYQRFQTGLSACRGFLPLVQGGVTRAPGTLFRGLAKGPCVLIPFVFAANDAVLLEFSANAMRVWRYGMPVMNGPVPYELATPYGAASLSRLRWVQSADVIYLCDGLQPVQRLSRFALNSWTIAPQVFETGPFRVQNLDKTMTVRASASTGSVTLTANVALFQSGHVGSLMRLRPTDNTAVSLWTSNESLAVGAQRRYRRNIYALVAGSNSGDNPPVHEEGIDQVDNAPTRWEYLGDDVGVVRITAVVSSTSATATVIRRVPEACVTSPTYRWSEGAWSPLYGYPAQIELYDQRLVLAATPSEPRTVWFSTVGAFNDFLDGTEADEAFAYTIAGEGSINTVQNLRRGRAGLHIFALGEEYSTRSESRAQTIGPTTAVFSLDGSIGSSPARPIAPDGDPIFIARDKRRVLQISYSLDRDGNQSRNLSRVAQHLGAGLFEQIVWQSAPEPIAWLRRASGDLVAMIYDRAEDVLGWAQITVADGFVESIAVTPDASGTGDILSLVVRRTVNGVTVRHVEEQASIFGLLTGELDVARAVHFFSAIAFNLEVPQDGFSLPHLAEKAVYAWTDRGDFGPFTVAANGAITLPVPASRGCIGLLDETHLFETLDVQAATANGNSMGRNKKIPGKVGIALHRTAQGRLQAIERKLGEDPRPVTTKMLVVAPVGTAFNQGLSGLTQIDVSTGHAREITLRFLPHSGAPMTVTAIIPNIEEVGS